MPYVTKERSFGASLDRTEDVLRAIVNRYIGANPRTLPTYRLLNVEGFIRDNEYRYDMNLMEKLPQLQDGQFVYAWAKIWADEDTSQAYRISCYSHARVFINGQLAFESNHRDDVMPESKAGLRGKLRQGWNFFVLEFEKTPTGCGAKFGTGSVKGAPVHFLAPSIEREGQEGWVYSEPQHIRWIPGNVKEVNTYDIDSKLASIFEAEISASEAATGLTWYPRSEWSEEEQQLGVFARVFDTGMGAEIKEKANVEGNTRGSDGDDASANVSANASSNASSNAITNVLTRASADTVVTADCLDCPLGSVALAWSRLDHRGTSSERRVTWKGLHVGTFKLYVDGNLLYASDQDQGYFEVETELDYGMHDVVVVSARTRQAWGFDLDVFAGEETGEALTWSRPYPIEGLTGHWLYLGPFSKDRVPQPRDVPHMDCLFGEGDERTYFRADQPAARIRPYLESRLYGKWNYPLGVTLYGILETGRELSRPDYIDYAAGHIEQCTSLDELVMWDIERHGAPGMNHQLALIDSLDDCGSFGATMLRAHVLKELRGAEEAAHRIAAYITHEQDRLPDGTLYRYRSFSELMVNTIWCDDLYMSTPFLSQYYKLTGETRYLDDAAAQFLLYKKRLYMPEQRMMHHVYNLNFDKGCTVPWGRGNGWVLFSLTELLTVLPETHPNYNDLLHFYRELCEGYLAVQDEQGLWHQVLTDHESYSETSCSSMFIYAFSRGIRYGWLPEEIQRQYAEAVFRGYEGIIRHCIDRDGNVYGVCRGSGYSFSPNYYKERLSWLLNDTHGIGIVLLAGIESLRLREYLKETRAASIRSCPQ
ncbi:glycoside hydrolase family 105 protein [Paenibacillus provencensis]|uniref:Glycoside hydrolase family 105 protein n=1 Tax=Paenibacillus provencensis TaxID=441151 RepID=A0ABW3PQZ1_9BACL|nr:glycoside hydrolase family 88 protein [Paenibacillus sp. MER 78]MCM3128022.1 glycoside hydrolase family 88 protein [Paenibacillus sp. MER 78]